VRENIINIIIALLIVSMWPIAITHSLRCYKDSGVQGIAMMFAPLYFIGVITDRAMGYECDK